MTKTDTVAWWGAVLASIVFIWDIIKWWRNSTRLRFIVRPDTYYQDSETVPLPGEPKGGGWVKPSIHIELNNIGIYPTTILSVWAERKLDQGGTVGDSGPAFTMHFGKTLPYMIGVGDIWSCRIDQARLTKIASKAPLKIYVAVSHLEKPLVKNVVFTRGGTNGGKFSRWMEESPMGRVFKRFFQ